MSDIRHYISIVENELLLENESQLDPKRAQIWQLIKQLHALNPGPRMSDEQIMNNLVNASDAELPDWEKHAQTLLAQAQAAPAHPQPPTPKYNAAEEQVLADMMSRCEQAYYDWALDYYQDDGEEFVNELFADPHEKLDHFNEFLDDRYSARVNEHGLVEFWKLIDDLADIIGDCPVQLYHYTAEGILPKIKKHGLHNRGKKVNPYQNSGSGVYLTTEGSGPAVNGYIRAAEQGHGGSGVCLTLKMFLHEIEPDPDDADIRSGAVQFIAQDIPPDRIVEIERV